MIILWVWDDLFEITIDKIISNSYAQPMFLGYLSMIELSRLHYPQFEGYACARDTKKYYRRIFR